MTRNRAVSRRIGALMCAALIFAPARRMIAQTTTGTVRGTVTGQNGAPLANAQIGARNVESGVPRGATSREDGTYVLPRLQPGTYDFTIRRIGYTPTMRRVVVQIGTTQIQDFNLKAQAITLGTVAVTAERA